MLDVKRTVKQLYQLPHQHLLWTDESNDSEICLVGPLGTGKTYSLYIKAFYLAKVNGGLPGLLLVPTLTMAKRTHAVEWPILAHTMGFKLTWLPGKQAFQWPWGAMTYVVSAENPQRLAGPNMAYLLVDEPGQMDPEAWERAAGRIRHPAAVLRQKVLAGTPEGLNWYADKFDFEGLRRVKYEIGGKELIIQRRVIRAKHWHPDMAHYPVQLLDLYGHDTALVDAYARGMFVPMRQGRAYSSYVANVHDDSHVQYNQDKPIVVFCDFNVDYMRWELGHVDERKIHVFDEIAMPPDSTTRGTVDLFIEQYLQEHRAPVLVTGDASGHQRSSSGSTDYKIIKERLSTVDGLEFMIKTPKKNPRVRDRVDVTNIHLAKHSNQSREFRVNPRCEQLKRDLQRVCWPKSGRKVDLDKDSDTSLTHSSEGLSQGIHMLAPIKGVNRAEASKPSMRESFVRNDIALGAEF